MFGRKREKIFGYGDGTPGMDGNAKVRCVAYAHGWNARHRRPGQHNGPLTKSFMDVLEALLWGFCHGKDGRCFPSYRTIAAKARVSRSTVAAAVKMLELAGVLTWSHRLVRRLAGVRRTSNTYRFLPAAWAVRAEGPRAESKIQLGQRLLSLFTRISPSPIDPDSPLEKALANFGRTIAARFPQST